MSPVKFEQSNCEFGPPSDLHESQCMRIPGFKGQVNNGKSVDGAPLVVVAWKPSEEELIRLKEGHPIYLSVIGGLFPHFLTTDFKEAINPA